MKHFNGDLAVYLRNLAAPWLQAEERHSDLDLVLPCGVRLVGRLHGQRQGDFSHRVRLIFCWHKLPLARPYGALWRAAGHVFPICRYGRNWAVILECPVLNFDDG